MENFIVSARKYRPATFDTVVGQKSITNTLKNAIKNQQLAQAFLFCGPRGIGKTTCARIFAKTINCMNITENIEPCNECESCVSFNNSASFNIHELDAASNNSVDDIRNLVDQVRIPPQVGKYKVYIIDEVHMLSQAAFNAFLKTLEEPPAYAKFILATTEKHKILPTILSRCQIFDFKRIVVEDIAGHLAYVANSENVHAEKNALHIIAQKADGAMRDALSIFDQIVSFSGNTITYQNVIENLNVLDYDYYFKAVDFLLNNDTTNSLLIINEIIDNGFDGQHFLLGLGEHLRNLLVCKDTATIKLMEVSDDFKERYASQAGKCDIMFLLKALDLNNNCDINYKISNNKRLHLELAIMKMCGLNAASSQEVKTATQSIPTEKKNLKIKVQEKAIEKDPIQAAEPEKLSEKKIAEAKPEPAKVKPVESRIEEPVKVVNKAILPNTSFGTVSIKQIVKKEEEKKDIPNAEEPVETYKPSKEFTQNELNEAWKVYAIRVSESEQSFASALTKYPPILQDNYQVQFKTDNKIIANDIVNLGGLLGFLKEKLGNHKIVIKPLVLEKDEGSRAYTDKEKFEKMTRKNPVLLKLKSNLDLEIDF
jgi:DNA polymerase III subunit gamma/tau